MRQDNTKMTNKQAVIQKESLFETSQRAARGSKNNAIAIKPHKGAESALKVLNDNFKELKCWRNPLQGWSCPIATQKEIVHLLRDKKINADLKICHDPYFDMTDGCKASERIYNRILYLEKQKFEKENLLIVDEYKLQEEIGLRHLDENTPEIIKNKNNLACRKQQLDELQTEIDCLRNSVDLLEQQSAEIILNSKTPLASAEKLVEKQFIWNGIKTIHYCGDSFWIWRERCYEEASLNSIRQIIYTFLKNAKIKGKDTTNPILVDFDPNKGNVDYILDALKAINDLNHVPESGTTWIEQRNFPSVNSLIVFYNGILNIEDWMLNKSVSLIKHTPLLINSGYLPFDFLQNNEDPKEWLSFLESIWPGDPQSIETLQEWFGLCLTQNTSMHKILLLVGPPRSGKGTIARILRALIGEKNSIGPTLSSMAGPFGLQQWLNKTLAIISDARLSGKSDHGIITERLLTISGEDSLTIDRKHREAITTKLPTRIMIMTNELPNLADSSSALANRYVILSMMNSWLGKEDPQLENRLRPELSQILIWALNGLERLCQRKRFIQPESAQQHIEELMSMTSPVKKFIVERCEISPTKWVETNTLFNEWIKWCEEQGYEKAGNLQIFGRNLRAALPQIQIKQQRKERTSSDKNDRMRVYNGIGLSILSV